MWPGEQAVLDLKKEYNKGVVPVAVEKYGVNNWHNDKSFLSYCL